MSRRGQETLKGLYFESTYPPNQPNAGGRGIKHGLPHGKLN